MSKLIFANLNIDRLWDDYRLMDQVFKAVVPQSLHLLNNILDLGLYYSEKSDQFVVFSKPDPEFISFLKQLGVDPGNAVVVEQNPYDISEFIEQLSIELRESSFENSLFVGQSALEEKVLLQIDQLLDHQQTLDYRDANNKMLLLEIVESLKLAFPATKPITTNELLHAADRGSSIFKYAFSNGGGGSFDGKDEKILSYLDRMIGIHRNETLWLKQEKIFGVYKEYCFYTHLDKSKIHTYQIEYDENGLSRVHSLPDSDIDLTPIKEIKFWVIKRFPRLKGNPFGVDAIQTRGGLMFPCIDLNIRMTKSHMIHQAAIRFKIDLGSYESHRIRFIADPYKDFSSWFGELQKNLQIDEQGRNPEGFFVIPYVVSSLGFGKSEEQVGTTREVMVFVGHPDKNVDLSGWRERVKDAIK